MNEVKRKEVRKPLSVKVSLLLFGLVFSLGILIYILLQVVIFPSYAAIEREDAQMELRHSQKAILNEIEAIDLLAFSLAAWDDTYMFVQNHNPVYIRTNLQKNAFHSYQINLMYIYDNNRNLIWGGTHDLETQKELPGTNAISAEISQVHLIFDLPTVDSLRKGVLVTGNGALLLVSRPIITSLHKGPVMGTIVLGRFLTKEYVKRITERNRLNFKIAALLTQDISSEIDEIHQQITSDKPYYISTKDRDYLEIYGIMNDINDHPAILIQAGIPRGISAKGDETAWYLFLAVLGGGIILILLLMFFLQRMIIKPITKLTSTMMAIHQSNDLSQRCQVYGTDEIALLSKEINHALDTLQKTQGGMYAQILERTEALNETDKRLSLEKQEHMLAADSLRRNQEFFRELFENSPFGIVMLDAQNKIKKINHAFKRIFQFSIDEILDRDLNDLIAPEDRKKEADDLTERTFMGQTVFLETQRKRKDGTLVDVQIHGLPIFLETERIGIYGVYIDVTTEKQIEREKKRLTDQLVEAQKMETVGTLAGGMAHEFNNLIAIMLGNIELLLESSDKPSTLKRLQSIKKSADRCAKLTGQLLSYSRKQMLVMELLDINELLQRIVLMFPSIFGDAVAFETVFQPGIIRVKGDQSQLTQVIMDIVQNAYDAMPEGGKLSLSTLSLYLDEGMLPCAASISSGMFVCISISDTGCGMDCETLNHIFEPFFTTKPPGRATGLGLAFVYGTIMQHNGCVDVISKPGEGTTFKIYLPQLNPSSPNHNMEH